MSTGPIGRDRPADVIGNAVHVRRIATIRRLRNRRDPGRDLDGGWRSRPIAGYHGPSGTVWAKARPWPLELHQLSIRLYGVKLDGFFGMG
jgi:hypothetical protein